MHTPGLLFGLRSVSMSPQRFLRVPVTILLTIPVGLLAALAGILGNIAASNIPPFIILYLHYTWPTLWRGGLIRYWHLGLQVHRDALISSPASPAARENIIPSSTPALVQQQNASSGYHTCVFSYATEDQQFAEKLHADLQQQGVSCWFALHDLKRGDKIRSQIYVAIRKNGKLLLVLSEHSISSLWEEEKVDAALDQEHLQSGTLLLFPIRLDNTVMQTAKV